MYMEVSSLSVDWNMLKSWPLGVGRSHTFTSEYVQNFFSSEKQQCWDNVSQVSVGCVILFCNVCYIYNLYMKKKKTFCRFHLHLSLNLFSIIYIKKKCTMHVNLRSKPMFVEWRKVNYLKEWRESVQSAQSVFSLIVATVSTNREIYRYIRKNYIYYNIHVLCI